MFASQHRDNDQTSGICKHPGPEFPGESGLKYSHHIAVWFGEVFDWLTDRDPSIGSVDPLTGIIPVSSIIFHSHTLSLPDYSQYPIYVYVFCASIFSFSATLWFHIPNFPTPNLNSIISMTLSPKVLLSLAFHPFILAPFWSRLICINQPLASFTSDCGCHVIAPPEMNGFQPHVTSVMFILPFICS